VTPLLHEKIEIPVLTAEGRQQLICGLSTRWPNSLNRSWVEALRDRNDVTSAMVDAVDFAASARQKWHFYFQRGMTVSSVDQLRQQISSEPRGERLGMCYAIAGWQRQNMYLGLALFRRTWCNHISLDFLAVHPDLLKTSRRVQGVGLALLYRVYLIAKEVNAKKIWLETTDSSVGYYEHLFHLDHLEDLLIVPLSEFERCIASRFAENR
jgi:hypothetical protein